MKSEIVTIGPFTIQGYGLMIAIGIIAAYIMAEYRATKKGLDKEQIFGLAVWGLLGGMIGAKLLYYITRWKDILSDPSILLDIANGFVIYGAIIGGVLAGLLYCKRKKLNFWNYFDLVVPSIALAQGFGRVGCLLAGCCYGAKTTGWFAITFTNSPLAPNGIPLIPTQIISSGLNFIHFLVLIIIAKKVKIEGVVAGCYLVFYSVGRFILEYYRGDLARGSVGSISTSQFISIFIFVIGLCIIIYQTMKTKMNIQKQP